MTPTNVCMCLISYSSSLILVYYPMAICNPGGHWWSYSPCALPLGSVIVIHLRIEYSKILRVRSRNVLQYNNCKETEHIKQSESSATSHALVIFWTLLLPMLYIFVDLDSFSFTNQVRIICIMCWSAIFLDFRPSSSVACTHPSPITFLCIGIIK